MHRLISFAALLGMVLAQPALAQMSAPASKSGAPAPGAYAALPCDGDVANVRLTQILPTGTMKGYLQAVDEHRAWYRKRFGEVREEWYIFPWGRPMPSNPTRHITSFKTAWKTMRKNAKVRGRWHDNRHTLITELAESGAGD